MGVVECSIWNVLSGFVWWGQWYRFVQETAADCDVLVDLDTGVPTAQ